MEHLPACSAKPPQGLGPYKPAKLMAQIAKSRLSSWAIAPASPSVKDSFAELSAGQLEIRLTQQKAPLCKTVFREEDTTA
jgi:hypothetical protein